MFTFKEFIIFLVILYIVKSLWNWKTIRRPPGPINFPIVGYLFQLGKKPHLTLTELGKKYGEVIYMRVGNRDVVVLNGHNTIIEALSDNSVNFAGRPDFLLYKFLSQYGMFAFMNYCPEWRTKRKLTTRAINSIVERRSHSSDFANSLNLVCCELSDRVRQNMGVPYDPKEDCFITAYQIMISFCFGNHVLEYNEFFKEVKKNVDSFGSITSFYNIINAFRFFNYLADIPFFFLKSETDKFFQSMEDYIKKRLAIKDDNKIICMVDSLNAAHALERDEKKKLRFLLEIMNDVMGAGVGTTNQFLYYVFLYLTKFPQWQMKIQLQINKIVKENEDLTMDHIDKLTLLNAFLLEIKRHSSFLPFSIYRSVIKDITFRSYFIAQDTLIIPNIYSAHFDETIWSEPNKFDPNRFLTHNGNIDINAEAKVLIFGIGRRRCIGQHLADKNIATIIAYLLKQFSFSPVLKEDHLDTYANGTIIEPKRFKMIVSKQLST